MDKSVEALVQPEAAERSAKVEESGTTIRHMMRLPVVQIIRSTDKVPFDINQMRTVTIDDSDIYSLVPKIESYRSEISSQIRRALDDPDSVDNPITTYYPNLRAVLN
jgi:hypothetical protein